MVPMYIKARYPEQKAAADKSLYVNENDSALYRDVMRTGVAV